MDQKESQRTVKYHKVQKCTEKYQNITKKQKLPQSMTKYQKVPKHNKLKAKETEIKRN